MRNASSVLRVKSSISEGQLTLSLGDFREGNRRNITADNQTQTQIGIKQMSGKGVNAVERGARAWRNI